MENLKIINDNILVEPIEKDETTKSGLIVSTVSDTGFKRGRVVDYGDLWESFGRIVSNADFMPKEIRLDDIVFYKSSQDFMYDGKKYHIVKQKDLVAIDRNDE